MMLHPLRISDSMQSGVSGRDGCTQSVGPHKSKNRMQTRRRLRMSRAGCTNAQQVDKQITEYRILAWRSPPMAITDVHHTCHLMSGQCTRKYKCTTSPSPQFACPQRGRKRLSREATLHTELALEWPDLVQIGRCKVQWLPSGVKKRILTRFTQIRQSYNRCRRRSQTPRLLCSACSLQTVALFGRLGNGFEVCTHNLQGSSQSKQCTVEFTVHRQVRTHGHNAQQTHERCQPAGSQNGECSLQNKAKWYNDNIPTNATH